MICEVGCGVTQVKAYNGDMFLSEYLGSLLKSVLMGIYCRFLVVPDDIQLLKRHSHGTCVTQTKCMRASVSLDGITTVLNWLSTACNTNFVLVSSCVAFS